MTESEQLLTAQLWGMARIMRPTIPGGSNNPSCEDPETAPEAQGRPGTSRSEEAA
jgi:hypothetical protein